MSVKAEKRTGELDGEVVRKRRASRGRCGDEVGVMNERTGGAGEEAMRMKSKRSWSA